MNDFMLYAYELPYDKCNFKDVQGSCGGKRPPILVCINNLMMPGTRLLNLQRSMVLYQMRGGFVTFHFLKVNGLKFVYKVIMRNI